MDDSVNELIFFPGWSVPKTAMGVQCNCLVGDLPHLRDAIIPLCRAKALHPALMI